MAAPGLPPDIHVYTQEEIEFFLRGDRRAIDLLLIQSMNNIIAVLLPHIEREERILKSLGDEKEIKIRVEWINAQIARQTEHTNMMKRVSESALIWACLSVVGFVLWSAWEHIVNLIKLGGGHK